MIEQIHDLIDVVRDLDCGKVDCVFAISPNAQRPRGCTCQIGKPYSGKASRERLTRVLRKLAELDD